MALSDFAVGANNAVQRILARRLAAELQAKKDEQEAFNNERLLKADARAQQQLDATIEQNRYNRERQDRLDAIGAENTQSLMRDREFKQADDVRESLLPGTELPTADQTAGRLQKFGLLTTSTKAAPGMGESFQGPMPTGEAPESVANNKPERYILTPTAAQQKVANDEAYKRDMNERQAARDAEMARHNQAMENRPTSAGVSPAVESNIINRLTKTWNDESKTTRELNRQLTMMDAGLEAAKNGDRAQGSQAVLVTFQKILDPTSVVRESEYMRSSAGQSLLKQIQGSMERLTMGGAGVPLDELEKYANLARNVVQRSNDSPRLKQVRARIERTANRYGIPADVIFDDEMDGGSAPAAATTEPQGAGNFKVVGVRPAGGGK